MMKYINNETELNEATKEGITIVDFYANWCGPCRMLSPVLEELEEENSGISIAKVDVDDNEDLVRKYGIMSVPTLLIFKNGEKIATSTGVVSENRILELIK